MATTPVTSTTTAAPKAKAATRGAEPTAAGAPARGAGAKGKTVAMKGKAAAGAKVRAAAETGAAAKGKKVAAATAVKAKGEKVAAKGKTGAAATAAKGKKVAAEGKAAAGAKARAAAETGVAAKARAAAKTGAGAKGKKVAGKGKAVAVARGEQEVVAKGGGEVLHGYRLIVQVDPGGSRKAESFVGGTLAEVQGAALDDLASGQGAYHALFYGEEIVLECWEGGRRVAAIDLHPFITYTIGGEALTLSPGAEPPLSMEDEEALMMELVEETLEFEVEVDWGALRLPQLRGRPLRPGESMPLERGRVWAHGLHEHWDMKIET